MIIDIERKIVERNGNKILKLLEKIRGRIGNGDLKLVCLE